MSSYKVWSYTASNPYATPIGFFKTETHVPDDTKFEINFEKAHKGTTFEGVISICPTCRRETILTDEEVSAGVQVACDCTREQKALPGGRDD